MWFLSRGLVPAIKSVIEKFITTKYNYLLSKKLLQKKWSQIHPNESY
jgi:hypothetical protein